MKLPPLFPETLRYGRLSGAAPLSFFWHPQGAHGLSGVAANDPGRRPLLVNFNGEKPPWIGLAPNVAGVYLPLQGQLKVRLLSAPVATPDDYPFGQLAIGDRVIQLLCRKPETFGGGDGLAYLDLATGDVAGFDITDFAWVKDWELVLTLPDTEAIAVFQSQELQ